MEIIVPGIVYLVGAGPGDPELLTLKALRLIKNCDELVHDALIPDEITKEAGKHTEIFHVGKRILSLNRSFKRVIKALRRVNFLLSFNKFSFTIFTFIPINFYYHTC